MSETPAAPRRRRTTARGENRQLAGEQLPHRGSCGGRLAAQDILGFGGNLQFRVHTPQQAAQLNVAGTAQAQEFRRLRQKKEHRQRQYHGNGTAEEEQALPIVIRQDGGSDEPRQTRPYGGTREDYGDERGAVAGEARTR